MEDDTVLPLELWDKIISYCEFETLEALRLVNRLFAELLSVNQTIWRKWCEEEYGFVRSDYWQKACGKLELPILTILDIPQHIVERQGVDEYEFEKERTWIRRKKCENYFYLYSWFKKQGGKREVQIYEDDCIYPLKKGQYWSEPMEGNNEYFKEEIEPWKFITSTNNMCCWPSIHTHYVKSACYSETQNVIKQHNCRNNRGSDDDCDHDDVFERPVVKLQFVTQQSTSTALSKMEDRHPIPYTNRYISYAKRERGCILLSDTVEFHTFDGKHGKEWIVLYDYLLRYWGMLKKKGEVGNKEITAEDEQFYRDIQIRFAEIMLLVAELLQNILVCCQKTNTKYPTLAFDLFTTIFNEEKKQIYIENIGVGHFCGCIIRCSHMLTPYYGVLAADPFDHQGEVFDYTLTPLRCTAILGRLLR